MCGSKCEGMIFVLLSSDCVLCFLFAGGQAMKHKRLAVDHGEHGGWSASRVRSVRCGSRYKRDCELDKNLSGRDPRACDEDFSVSEESETSVVAH